MRNPRLWRSAVILFLALLAASCAARPRSPLDEMGDLESVKAPFVPLEIRELQVVKADGKRGVFLKLSRLPGGVVSRSEEEPARLVLSIQGPTVESNQTESFPAGDRLLSRIAVTPRPGELEVVLYAAGTSLPSYSVHAMTDWVMVRFERED
jgi:hypothetical protein